MVILKHIFPKILHNMVDCNTKNSIAKKFFFKTYIARLQNIFVAKNVCQYVLKNANIDKK
jgi:hypothetical protein